jgi:cytochrome c-type protein NapB
MFKQSIIVIATLGLISVSASAFDTKTCAGCHGVDFEKKAMNVSKIVKDLSKDDIVKALKGYKDGSYGGAMKGVMAGQAKPLSDADIEAIATQVAGGDKKADAKTEAKAEVKAEDNATKVEDNTTKAEDNATKAEPKAEEKKEAK